MNCRKIVVLITLITSTALPVQANVQTMAAHTLSYLKQGLKLYVANPIMWGYHKTLTPATLTAALVAGAGVTYLANSVYGRPGKQAEKSSQQKMIENGCMWTTTAGIGAGAGATLAWLISRSATKGAWFGGCATVGGLLAAELYRKYHQKEEASLTSLMRERETDIEKTDRDENHIGNVTIGDICTLTTLFGIGSLAGIGSTWLMRGPTDLSRSAVAGLIGACAAKYVFDKQWLSNI